MHLACVDVRTTSGVGGLRQLAVLDAKLLEFRGGSLGSLAPPFEVVHDQLCLTVRADRVGSSGFVQRGRILQRHATERVVIATIEVVRVVHQRGGCLPYDSCGVVPLLRT